MFNFVAVLLLHLVGLTAVEVCLLVGLVAVELFTLGDSCSS